MKSALLLRFQIYLDSHPQANQIIPKRWSSNYKGIDDLLLSFIERRRITDSIFGRL